MTNFAAAGFGCVAALALWKGTKERWVPTLLGMFVIVVTVKYSLKADDGFSWAIWLFGYAIFMASVYLLNRYDMCKAESRPFFSKAESWKPSRKPETQKLLRCSFGYKREGHFIGPNEPYRFLSEEGYLSGQPDTSGDSGLACLDCIQKNRKELDESLARRDKGRKKKYEWANNLSREEREARHHAGIATGFCPMCDEPLNERESCPICFQFPANPNAPQNHRTVAEWAALSETEWAALESDAIAQRERNLAEWCTKGADGVWRQNDSGQVWGGPVWDS